MHLRLFWALLVTVSFLVVGGEALAQTATQPRSMVPQKPFNKYDAIQTAEWDLIYGNEKDWEEGLTLLKQVSDERLAPNLAQWRDEKWRDYICGRLEPALQEVFAAKHYELCDQAATYGTLVGATQLPWLEKFLSLRVQSNLKLGKMQEALALAKSYYNVCSMPKTSDAIDQICLCLIEDPSNASAAAAIRKFRIQQSTGAVPPANTPGAASPARPASFLDSIKIDAGPYAKSLETLAAREQTYIRLIDRGNLLLLSDKPSEARALFNKAYALAGQKQLAEAGEAVARSMRAEDHAVGRANAWILSLRPEVQSK